MVYIFIHHKRKQFCVIGKLVTQVFFRNNFKTGQTDIKIGMW
jgi:hypothetical protein